MDPKEYSYWANLVDTIIGFTPPHPPVGWHIEFGDTVINGHVTSILAYICFSLRIPCPPTKNGTLSFMRGRTTGGSAPNREPKPFSNVWRETRGKNEKSSVELAATEAFALRVSTQAAAEVGVEVQAGVKSDSTAIRRTDA